MKQMKNQKKNIFEKVFLGSEMTCYLLAGASLIQSLINLFNKENGMVKICNICAVAFIITGFIIRLLSKKVNKDLNEFISFKKESKNIKKYSFTLNKNNQKTNFLTNVGEMSTN